MKYYLSLLLFVVVTLFVSVSVLAPTNLTPTVELEERFVYFPEYDIYEPVWGDYTETEEEEILVYQTPYGKRYHLSPWCGGKNSSRILIKRAIKAGLTPCRKCVY